MIVKAILALCICIVFQVTVQTNLISDLESSYIFLFVFKNLILPKAVKSRNIFFCQEVPTS